MTYLFTILLIIISYHLLIRKESINNKYIIVFSKKRVVYHILIASWFIILLSVRNDYMFTDTQNYRAIYENPEAYGVRNMLNEISVFNDFGFYSFFYYLSHLGIPFRLVLFLHSVLYVGSISYLIFKYSKKPWFSYLLFMFMGFMAFTTTMRQSFAQSFILLATIFALKRSLVGYLIFIALAISFHTTAIIASPIWMIISQKNWKYTAFFLISLVLLFIFAPNILEFAISKSEREYSVKETGGWGTLFFTAVVILVGYLNKSSLKNSDVFLRLYASSMLFFPFAKLNPAFFRVYLYYSVFLLILAPNIISINKKVNHVFFIFILLFSIMKFTYGSKSSGVRVFPYVTMWENYFVANPKARGLDLL